MFDFNLAVAPSRPSTLSRWKCCGTIKIFSPGLSRTKSAWTRQKRYVDYLVVWCRWLKHLSQYYRLFEQNKIAKTVFIL